MPQKFLSVKNFEQYQHYKHRNPPWIKLYKSILTDPGFMKLSTEAKYLYLGLLILASETGNRVLNDHSYIAHRLCIDPSRIDLNPLYKEGFLLACSNTIRRYHALSETETETEKSRDREETENSSETTASVVRLPVRRATRKSAEPSKTAPTWESYAEAYVSRYGAAPVRNAKVNGTLARLIERLGESEAPQVAAFYVSHNKPFYVQARHPTELLLRDAEGLRTEWATGVKATTGEARNAERRDDALAQIERVRRAMQQEGA